MVNDIRGVQGYTGKYKNKKVSVMASGMGVSSIGIYAFELYNAFDVERIIRVGTAGSLREDVKLRDLVVAIGASTNTNFADTFGMKGTIAPIASFNLLKKTDEIINKLGLSGKTKFGNIITNNIFYDDAYSTYEWAKNGNFSNRNGNCRALFNSPKTW